MRDIPEAIDITIRFVPGVGFLPMIIEDYDKEVFRGEYKSHPKNALDNAIGQVFKMHGMNEQLKNLDTGCRCPVCDGLLSHKCTHCSSLDINF